MTKKHFRHLKQLTVWRRRRDGGSWRTHGEVREDIADRYMAINGQCKIFEYKMGEQRGKETSSDDE